MKKSNPLTRAKKQKAMALLQTNSLHDAKALLEQVCKTDPRDGEAWALLGTINTNLGHYDKATYYLGKAALIEPERSEIHFNLGHALHASGKLDQAISSYREAIRLQPSLGAAHCNLGTVYEALHRYPEAVSSHREAVRLLPRNAEMPYNLGNALMQTGQVAEAADAFRSAIKLNPAHTRAHINLGVVLMEMGENEASDATLRRAISIEPGNDAAYHNLGKLLLECGSLTEAIGCYRQALRINPRSLDSYRGLSTALRDSGDFDGSISTIRRALEIQPDFEPARVALIYGMNYLETADTASVYEEHVAWGRQISRQIPANIAFSNSRDPGRRLRVGYVSGDFRRHSVAYFIEPILAHHNGEQFESFCYANVFRPDNVTDHLKGLAANWRDITRQEDDEVAALIRDDQIDILVDLAGHSAKNRLPVFARKPAPVQVTYLGYPNTTGLPAMNYRLTDAIADPAGQEAFHTEQLVRLPGGFLCFQPPSHAPAVEPAPALTAGHVTFGSFNNLSKIGASVIALWSKALQALPKSRLILKNMSLRDEETRKRYLALFDQNSIADNRVELIGWLPSKEDHLALYNRIDIALDTFPYNGTTTTCEALWMGVPVVVLEGNRHAARVGVSVLTRVGLPELFARDETDYVRIAVELANDPARLAELRQGLRERMRASPLCDGKSFTRDLEEAYRGMWKNWCTSSSRRPD